MIIKTLYVFDIDDTLTQTAQLHQDAFVQALIQLGVKEMDTNFSDYKHHTDSYIARKIYEKDQSSSFDFSTLAIFEQYLLEIIESYNIEEIVGAKNTLSKIEKHPSMGLCYATGSLLNPARYKLKQIGLSEFDNRLAASNAIEERENIVLAAIEKAKAYYDQNSFERIISVGDGLWDLKTARNLSLEFIGIGIRNQLLLEKNGATSLFDNLSQFFSP